MRGQSPQSGTSLIMEEKQPWVTCYLADAYWNPSLVSKGELLDLQDLPRVMHAAESSGKAKAQGLKGISRGSAELIEKLTIVDARQNCRQCDPRRQRARHQPRDPANQNDGLWSPSSEQIGADSRSADAHRLSGRYEGSTSRFKSWLPASCVEL
jgi:hypothetical protein